MSHFSEVKTNLKNQSTLMKALEKLGYEVVAPTEGVQVRGFFGESQPADFKILTDTHYDIGFRQQEDGNYEIVADWDVLPKVADITQEDFTNSVKREYAKTAIFEIAEQQGYDVSCTEDTETQNIEMVVTQW